MKVKDLESNRKEERIAHLDSELYDHLPRSLSVLGADAYYDFYRLMISMAGLPDKDVPVSSVLADFPFACAYTDKEQEMIEKTLKRHKLPARYHSSPGSKECSSVNKMSPIPQNSGKTIRRT